MVAIKTTGRVLRGAPFSPSGTRTHFSSARTLHARTAAQPCVGFDDPAMPPPRAVPAPRPAEQLPLVSMSEAARSMVLQAYTSQYSLLIFFQVEEAIHSCRNYSDNGLGAGAVTREELLRQAEHLGFLKGHVTEAALYTDDLPTLLDWLVIHVPEGDLPAAFKPSSMEISATQHTPESLARHYQATRLAAHGFNMADATAALETATYDDQRAWQLLLDGLVADGVAVASVTGVRDTAVLEEELEALAAIFAEVLCPHRSSPSNCVQFTPFNCAPHSNFIIVLFARISRWSVVRMAAVWYLLSPSLSPFSSPLALRAHILRSPW